MQSGLRCGTSGWVHEGWNSVVYPPIRQRGFHPLEYLSQHLELIEIDASFQKPLRPELSKLWVNKASQHPDFLFTVLLALELTYDCVHDPHTICAIEEGIWPLLTTRT